MLSVGKHPLVTRFMKGVFQLRPALPRYTETWNVGVVIKYLSNMVPTPELTMENPTKKLTMLLALLSGLWWPRTATGNSYNTFSIFIFIYFFLFLFSNFYFCFLI